MIIRHVQHVQHNIIINNNITTGAIRVKYVNVYKIRIVIIYIICITTSLIITVIYRYIVYNIYNL